MGKFAHGIDEVRPSSPSKSTGIGSPTAATSGHTRKASGSKPRSSSSKSRPSPAKPHAAADDDFGDFGEAGDEDFEEVDFGDFAKPPPAQSAANILNSVPLPSHDVSGRQTGFFALVPSTPEPSSTPGGARTPGPWYRTYKARHLALVPLCLHLRNSPSPSSTLSLLFPPDARTGLTPSLEEQGNLLLQLVSFLSSAIQPLHDWGFLRQAVLAAADRFDSTCLVAFEVADSKKDQDGMRTAAEASWKVWEAAGGRRDEWECGRVWVEKREVFYDTVKWDATENIM